MRGGDGTIGWVGRAMQDVQRWHLETPRWSSEQDDAHLQVCISGHQDRLLLVRPLHHHANQGLQHSLDLTYFIHKPEPHVSRDLIISRASGMQLSTQRTDKLAQAPLVRGVDVFIVRLRFELDAQICRKMERSRTRHER